MLDELLTLDDLCAATGESARTVRFYILNGLLSGPLGTGPAARYPVGHIAKLKAVRALQAEGMQLSKIREWLTQTPEAELATRLPAPPEPEPEGLVRTQWERIVLEPGVELHLCRPLSVATNRRVQKLLDFVRKQGR